MIAAIILFGIISYFIWKKTECIKSDYQPIVHIPADTRSAFPVISVQSPVSIQCCWQS